MPHQTARYSQISERDIFYGRAVRAQKLLNGLHFCRQPFKLQRDVDLLVPLCGHCLRQNGFWVSSLKAGKKARTRRRMVEVRD